MIGADYVKPGAAVIDVGINRTDDGLKGDVAVRRGGRAGRADHAGARRGRADDDRDAAAQHGDRGQAAVMSESGAPAGGGRPDREPVAVEDQIRRLHLERISREDWVMAGGGGRADLRSAACCPWFSFGATISVDSATVSIGGSLTAVDAPDAWLGVLALLSCAFLVADLGIERLSPQTRLPSIASRPRDDAVRPRVRRGGADRAEVPASTSGGSVSSPSASGWPCCSSAALVALTRRSRQAGRGRVAAGRAEPAPEPGSTA